jgi:hypothetical protein
MTSPQCRRSLTIFAAGVALLGALALPQLTACDDARLGRAPGIPTSTPATITTSTSALTKPTEDMDDETLVRKLAERYVEAVNDNDNATIAELNCAKAAPGLLQIAADGEPVTLTGAIGRARAQERYYVELKIGGQPAPPMKIIKRDGAWCVVD